MDRETELDFLLRRATEEIENADLCSDPVAAQIHRRMAVLYANRVAALGHHQHLEIVPQRLASAN